MSPTTIRSLRPYTLTTILTLGCLSLSQAAPLPPATIPGGQPGQSGRNGGAGVADSRLMQGEAPQQAAFLVSEAIKIAYRDPEARQVVVKTAAPLLARLPGSGADNRDGLTAQWMQLAMAQPLSREARLDAMESLFDSAARVDVDWARQQALRLPDPAGRTGAFLEISRALQDGNWAAAHEATLNARRALAQEGDPLIKARGLVFVAYSLTILGAEGQDEALAQASSAVRNLKNVRERDSLMTELVGAAAKYDLGLASRLAEVITDPRLKQLAIARVNIAEVSQTTLTSRSKERVTALATAAAPYDSRALPVLLQLPPEPDVLKAIAATLPPIYPSARPAISASQLVRIWEYSQKAPEGAYRDQLQSRVARLMVLHDLWRGRDWGKQLSWKGGRIQVGAFLKEVLNSRRNELKAGALQDVAKRNVARAYSDANQLAPAPRAEALLLLAGQILG